MRRDATLINASFALAFLFVLPRSLTLFLFICDSTYMYSKLKTNGSPGRGPKRLEAQNRNSAKRRAVTTKPMQSYYSLGGL
jgi:hypothetical protein